MISSTGVSSNSPLRRQASRRVARLGAIWRRLRGLPSVVGSVSMVVPSSSNAASLARRTNPLPSTSSTPVRMRRMIRPLISVRLAASAPRRSASAWVSRICRPSRLLTVAMAKKLTENISTSASGRSIGVPARLTPSSMFHTYSPTTAAAAAVATSMASGSGTSSAAAPTLNSSIMATPGAAPGMAWVINVATETSTIKPTRVCQTRDERSLRVASSSASAIGR